MFDFDFGYSKISKVIKDRTELELVRETIRPYYDKISNMYLAISVDSNYPHVGLNQMNLWLSNCQVHDTNLNSAVLDNILVAALVRTDETKPITAARDCLLRFEFLEVIVRTAMSKYKHAIISSREK
jgi:hypothetical protein